eukprot:TRINITY_DN1152_c0_g1_i4.p1 TRINITY_DN1152_c0_g1~~TRINITY_DN1152_c0_g1_i4.p1  ORF type:complete len:105 (+),score=9.57 TRINITY_DN1152_c0_g1_i4:100-414(+)
MRISVLLLVLLGVLMCYSMKIQTSAKTTRQQMNFYCESTMGPNSPHDACITFDSDKYHLCKGNLICQGTKLTRKETCVLADPPYSEIQLADVTDVCDEQEFKTL